MTQCALCPDSGVLALLIEQYLLFRLFEANVKRLKTCSGAPVKCTPGEMQAPPTISRPLGRTKAEPDGDEWITGSDGVEKGWSAFVCARESTRESVFVCHVYHDAFQTNLMRHYRTQTHTHTVLRASVCVSTHIYTIKFSKRVNI